MRSPTVIATWGGLAIIVLLSWLWIVPMARDMYGPMNGPSAWMMTGTWDLTHLALLWAMWAVMMAAMMLPSAMPLLMLYQGAVRGRSASGPVVLPVYALAGGYLLTWLGFSVGAVVLQRVLTRAFVLTPMMEMSTGTAIGVTLLIAGAYQFTPLKHLCLSQCRSPLAFVMQKWRSGIAGGFVMGVDHGTYCLGCCWALMLLLFAGGVMNLIVIAGLTVIVLVEKIAPFGRQASRVLGVFLIAGGFWFILPLLTSTFYLLTSHLFRGASL